MEALMLGDITVRTFKFAIAIALVVGFNTIEAKAQMGARSAMSGMGNGGPAARYMLC